MSDERTDKVAEYFSREEGYLTRRDTMLTRTAVLREWLAGRECTSILDVGCGDGSLSIPFLGERSRLTLLDLTEFMLRAAMENVPPEKRRNVTTVLGDFQGVDLPPGGFDLVLLVGVLAHVSDPSTVIDKAARLLRPGGRLVTQVSDAWHPVGLAWRVYQRGKAVICPPEYPLTKLSRRAVVRRFRQAGLRLVDEYRYNLPAPGLGRVLSAKTLHAMTQAVHGRPGRNRLSAFGSECLLLMEK